MFDFIIQAKIIQSISAEGLVTISNIYLKKLVSTSNRLGTAKNYFSNNVNKMFIALQKCTKI